MSKYIIRNCNVIYFNLDKTAICNDLSIEYPCECKERADCLLKQIVELCKGSIRENEHDIYRAGRMSLAVNILGKLDIQECE